MVKRPKARRFVVEKYACCCGNGDTIYSIILNHIIVYHGVVYSCIYYIGIYTQAQRGLLSTAIPFITVDWLIIQIIFFLFLVVNVVARSVPRARGYTIVVQLDALSLYVFSPALLVLRIVSLTTVFF